MKSTITIEKLDPSTLLLSSEAETSVQIRLLPS